MSLQEAMKRVDAKEAQYDSPYVTKETIKPTALTAATDKLKETHAKFIDGLRNELGKLYEMRANINDEINDKEQALAVCEQLMAHLQPTAPTQVYPTGAKF